MIVGSEADTRYKTEAAVPKATGTADKELLIIEGARHIETYWVDEDVDAAVSKLTPFFARTIAGQSTEALAAVLGIVHAPKGSGSSGSEALAHAADMVSVPLPRVGSC